MRRLGRQMQIGRLAVCLILFLLTAALWVRSAVVFDQYAWGTSRRWTSLWSARGGLVMTSLGTGGSNAHARTVGYQRGDPVLPELLYGPGNGDPGVRHDLRLLGFRARVSDGGRVVSTSTGAGATATVALTWRSGWLVRVPYWFICLVALLPVLVPLIGRRRRTMLQRRGRCPTCEYDLTGNLSGACPECGTAVHI